MNRAELKKAIEWAEVTFPACPHNPYTMVLIEAAKILSKQLDVSKVTEPVEGDKLCL